MHGCKSPLDKSTNFIQAQQCMKGKSQKTENTKELLSYQKPISEITLDAFLEQEQKNPLSVILP